MDKRLERILPRVQKPARYVGGEYNAVKKDPAQVDTRIAFCFPDTYEIGMSNLGMRILYGVMNNMDGVWCQRVFAPWGDMEEEMRRAGMPLFALESGEPITDFDIVAFSVGYEMAFPAILNMLDLAGIPFPLSSAYRCPKHNKAVGGVPTSAHTRGYAVDIRCVDSHSRFVMLQALLEVGFRRIELAPTWIHVDNDPDKPRDVAFYQHGGKY